MAQYFEYNKQWIQAFYIAYFGRPGDPSGVSYWLQKVTNGELTLVGVAENFAQSQEAMQKYAYFNAAYNYPNLITDDMREQFVIQVYQNLLERAPDDDGMTYWINQLRTGASSPGAFIANVIYSAMMGQEGDSAQDWDTIYTKVQAAECFTDYLVINNVQWTWALSDAVSAILDNVDYQDEIDQVEQEIRQAITREQNPGQTFTLTTGIDSITGTSGNDTINATDATINLGDVVNGGDGTDTLYVADTGSKNGVNFGLATISSVENLIYDAANGQGKTLDLANLGGLKSVSYQDKNGAATNITINTKGNATSVTVNGAEVVTINDTATTDTLASVAIKGNKGAATITSDALTSLSLTDTNQTAKVTAAAGTRRLDVTVNNVTGGATIEDKTATTVAVTATGAPSTIALTADAAKAMEFSGDKKLTATLGAQAGGLTISSTASELDLSGTTLNDDVTFTGSDGKESIKVGATTKAITMGKGDDTVELTGSALGAGGTVNGGDGTDTLVMTHANAIIATASTTVANFSGKVTGFEVLQVGASAGDGTINVGNLNASGWNTVNKVVFAGAVDDLTTVQDIASNGTVEFQATNSKATTVNVKNAATNTDDVLNIKVSNADVIDVNTITVDNVETINLNTDDSAATPTGIAHTMTLTAAAAKTLNVSGDAGVTLTLTGSLVLETINTSGVTKGAVSVTTVGTGSVTMIGGDTDTTFNASYVVATKVATITTGAGNDTITGGAGDDVINAGNGNNTIEGGGGADTLTGGTGVDIYVYTAVTDSQGAKIDTITNFQVGEGGDIIDLHSVTGGSGTFLGVANGYGAVLTSLTKSAGDTVLDSSTSTLYVDVNGDGALTNLDMAIQLTGVTSGLVDANFNF